MIIYRPAVAADTTSVISLLTEIMEHHGITPPPTERLQSVTTAVMVSSDHLFLLAEADDAVVGMCALVFSYSTWSTSLVCELQDVIVTSTSRRHNIGHGLVEAAEKMARARGCTRLFLTAESWTLEAHRFYRSLGLAEKTCLYFERALEETNL